MKGRGIRWLSGLGCWVVSAGVHAACLGSLAFVRGPSGGTLGRAEAGAVVSNAPAGRVLEMEPTGPKPQLKSLTTERIVPYAFDPGTFSDSRTDKMNRTVPSVLSKELVQPVTGFFGARCRAERICFVVDCSGSMFGRMGLVRRELTEAVEQLTADQFFSVLFFGGDGKIYESGQGQIRRALPAAKRQAIGLIETVRPGGQTDALSALTRAMAMRTPDGQGPDVIYFLTDGFDLDNDGTLGLADQVESLRQRLSPQAVIHPIAFWAASGDRLILQNIAQRSGGTLTCVDYELEAMD